MEEVALKNWGEFETQLKTLDALREEHAKGRTKSSSEYLFRGHSNASWPLETTLDRFFAKRISMVRYYQFALVARSRIEAFTGTRWEIPTRDKYEDWLVKHDRLTFHAFEAYDYFAYLRHHGFPSPLLDWTESPYVAAFFAFRNVSVDASHVAIYAYQEYPGVGKITSSDSPIIHRLGPYVSSHKRHFLQQSQYTFCTETEEHTLYYTKHQKVVEKNEPKQDLMWKFTMPASEQRSALAQLSRMNINAFSLFGSEDSLVETIAISKIYVRGRDL